MTRTWLYTLLALVALAGISYGLFRAMQPAPLPPQVVYGNGHVEGTEIRVIAEVPGRIVESHLVEGQAVRAGDLLVRIDDTELAERLAAARAERQVVEQRVAGVEAQRETWRRHLELAQRNYDRYAKLAGDGAVTAAQVDDAATRLADARGKVESLGADRTSLLAQAEAAGRRISLLEADLAKCRVRAPRDGWLQIRAVERGEVAVHGQLLCVVVDLAQVELKVFLAGPQMGKVKPGAPARVRVDAFPGEYFSGTVERIDQFAQFTPRDIHMPDERVRMVYGVTLRLPNPDTRLRPGMPADAWIKWMDDAAWPERMPVPGS